LSLFVDTSVWSLAMRHDGKDDVDEVQALVAALTDGRVVTTGLVLQELLQGFHGPRARGRIVERFAAVPLVTPDRLDHIAAADLRNDCRRRGIAVTTVDALIAQLCIRHDLTLLTTDRDFARIAKHRALVLWRP